VSASGLVTAIGAGTVTITATSENKTGSATLTVIAPSLALSRTAGDAQVGINGKAVADSLVVTVKTPAGAASAGTSVTWSSTSGSLSSATTTTDANGVAKVRYTLGSSVGAATVTASVPGAPAVTFSATGRASGSCSLATNSTTASFGLGASDYRLSLQPTAPHKAIVLFVDFSDAPATETTAALAAPVINPGLALLTEYSYGRTQFTPTLVNKWYRMSKPSVSYGFSALTFALQKAYIQEAMTLADPDVDFSQYDVVYIFSSAGAAIPVSPTFNAFAGTGVTFDGKEIHNGITFGNDARNNGGHAIVAYGATVLAHESGHMMGLIDLYSLTGQDASTQALYQSTIQKYVGPWSIMGWNSYGAHYLAWEKFKLGFLDASQVDCVDATPEGIEEVITPIETSGGVKAVAVQLDASRALVAEVRSKTGSDANLCAFGVLLYQVDATLATGTGAIVIKPSRRDTDQTKINTCGTYWDAPFDATGGSNSSYTDAATGVTMTVLGVDANGGYRVRIKRG
jgi:M6 family metalloprotease-like protein